MGGKRSGGYAPSLPAPAGLGQVVRNRGNIRLTHQDIYQVCPLGKELGVATNQFLFMKYRSIVHCSFSNPDFPLSHVFTQWHWVNVEELLIPIFLTYSVGALLNLNLPLFSAVFSFLFIYIQREVEIKWIVIATCDFLSNFKFDLEMIRYVILSLVINYLGVEGDPSNVQGTEILHERGAENSTVGAVNISHGQNVSSSESHNISLSKRDICILS